MQCSCGTDNAFNAKFCKSCGTPVQAASVTDKEQFKLCPSCSAQLKSSAKFCGKCSHKLSDSAELSLTAASMKQASPVVEVEPEVVAVQTPNIEVITAKVSSVTQVEEAGASKSNKKFILVWVILFVVAIVAAAGWYFIWAPKKDVLTVTATALVATPREIAPVASAQSAVPATATVPLLSSYLGKTAKFGTMLGTYMMGTVDQIKNFMILQGFDDEGRKLIVVTDLAGRVLDAKYIPEIDKAFISSNQACVVNNKPYVGVYVAAPFEKLALPSAVWKLTEDGKLLNESVANLKCAAYSECEPESDVCFNVGYNDKRKQELAKQSAVKQATTKSKVQSKKNTAHEIVPNHATLHHEQSAIATTATTTEPALQNEVIQEEPAKKKKNFFEKLEESVKNGVTETTCTDAERVLNQCK